MTMKKSLFVAAALSTLVGGWFAFKTASHELDTFLTLPETVKIQQAEIDSLKATLVEMGWGDKLHIVSPRPKGHGVGQ